MLVFTPVAISGCSTLSNPFAEKSEKVAPREELKRTELLWKVTLVAINESFKNGLIDERSKVGREISSAVAEVEAALEAWRSNPDSTTYRDIVKGLMDIAKNRFKEAREK